MKRFYKEVGVEPREGGFAVLLDGKPVKTPARADLVVPTRVLAESIAEEWREQKGQIAPDKMPLTKAANTAIDRVGPRTGEVIAELLNYAGADLLSYRAETPADLAARQARNWDPWLAWAERSHGAKLAVTSGIVAIEQPREAISALETVLRSHDPFSLTGLHAATTILGSLVLALALADAHLTARGAFELATLDERYQAEKWGVDAAAEARARGLEADLESAANFIGLARG